MAIKPEKQCANCKQVKTEKDFYRCKRRGVTYLYSYCKPCTLEKNVPWTKNNPDAVRKHKLDAYHKNKNLHPSWYSRNKKRFLKRFRNKNYPEPTRPEPERCEICGSPLGKTALSLDHDHETGKFRGWLCHLCNLGLGLFRDSEARLRNAAEYLEASK